MKQKLDAEEVIKYLVPFIGFYAITKSTIVNGQKKFLFYYLQTLVSGFILIVFIAILSGGSTKEEKGEFITKESDSSSPIFENKDSARNTEDEKQKYMEELSRKVTKLKSGNGHDWVAASINEQNMVCLDIINLFLKRDDVTEALKLCKEIDKTYSEPSIRVRPIAEIGVTLGTLTYGQIKR